MKHALFIIAGILYALPAYLQEPETTTDTLRADALNVYMQASDYLRKEIPYINYVRDLKDADVYIISTTQRTGSGGYEYTYFLTGQYEFAGMSDTVSFVTTPDETTDGRRRKEIATLKMGLIRYVAKTPLAQYININFSQPMTETVSTDNWKSWVFRTSLSGNFNSTKSVKYQYLSSTTTASKITRDWKINLRLYYYYRNNSYNVGDDIITSANKTKTFNTLIVRSINDHWSYGGSFTMTQDSYSNKDFEVSLLPGIEYDIYPYSESTRRQFRLLYRVGFSHVSYMDTTIYNKIRQNLCLQSLSGNYEIIQKWGSIDFTLQYRNYFHDWPKNNLSVYTYMNFRILKGLSFNVSAGADLIHDQLNLPKGTASQTQIITQQRVLETQYSFYTSFGFSYTFGSIYNNVVNPRFGE